MLYTACFLVLVISAIKGFSSPLALSSQYLCRYKGDVKAAIECFLRAVQADESNSDATLHLASVLHNIGL